MTVGVEYFDELDTQRDFNLGQSRSIYPLLAPAENKPLFIDEAVGYVSVDQSAWLAS
jgi:hypothetical protein